VASNYEVNIKLDTKQAKDQLRQLEERITKLNRMALSGKASRQAAQESREKLKLTNLELKNDLALLKVKEGELKLDKQSFLLEKQKSKAVASTNKQLKETKLRQDRISNSRALGPSSPLNFTNEGTLIPGAGIGGSQPKSKGIFASALISGSFPLLFGQGLPGAVAGGLGGGIGAAVGGQMGGFAGGLVATSLLQIFNNTADRLNTLGSALNDPSKNIQVLTERIKFFDKSVGTTISTLQSAGLERTAAELARITLENRVGPGQLEPIKMLNKEMDKFGMLARDLGMKINSVVAGPLTAFFKFMNLIMGGKNKTPKEDSNKTVEQSITESLNKFDELKPELDLARENLKALEEQIEKNKKIVEIGKERFRAGEDLLEIEKDLGLEGPMALRRLENSITGLQDKRRLQKENLKLLEEEVGNAERLVEIFKLEKQVLEAQGNELRDQLKLQEKQSSVIRGDANEKDLAIERKKVEVNKINRKLELERAELKLVERDGNKREIQAQEEKIANLELEKQLVIAIANERINAADPAISRMDELNRKMRDLNDTTEQAVILSKAMGESFEDSFKGIIKGTMTVADAFRNMLNKIADYFLDTAAQMVATQFQKGLLGLFSNLFNFSITPETNVFEGFDRGPASGVTMKKFANGGRPPVGRPSLVGERGPELFVPNSAGTIIPNHQLGGMGSMNIVVNVDASGSNVEGDEDEGRALGIALSAAIETELIKQKRPGGLLA